MGAAFVLLAAGAVVVLPQATMKNRQQSHINSVRIDSPYFERKIVSRNDKFFSMLA
jgi:hypothetical protein